MALPVRTIPHTPLDMLRVHLAEYAGDDNGFRSRLGGLLQQHRKQLLGELGRHLVQTTTPKGIRRGILVQVPRFDWPEWVPYIQEALQQEPDLGVFDDGCAALGAIANREAYEALKHLQTVRNDPDRQTILARELAQYQSQQPIGYHLVRLLEGKGNPKLAAQAAKIIAAHATEEALSSLIDAHRHGDEVTQRLALRVISSVRDPAAEAYLLEILRSSREEFLDLQQLGEVLRRMQPVARGNQKQELIHLVGERFRARVSHSAEYLDKVGAVEGVELGAELDAFKNVAQGACDKFLLEALALVVEGKYARYAAYFSETSETVESRSTLLTALCDEVAEALVYRADQKISSFGEMLPVFHQVLWARLGGEGFIQAFLSHLPATETTILDELLLEPNLGRRQICLNALGSREDDALVPFFLKAMQDSIVDVGLLAIHHLGKLPSSFQALMTLFESGQPEQVRAAIRVFGENQCRAAAEPLLEFIQKDTKDDLLVEAAEALTHLAYAPGASILLELLHDGKPLSLQISLAKALGAMATPEASLGLLHKSAFLKQAQVLILCLEGTLAAFPGFDRPLPNEEVPALVQLVERCCDEREGEGQRLRAMLAMQNFFAFAKNAYESLKDRFSDFLFDMRTKEAWDRENNDRVSAVVKELVRRSTSLGLIAKKETVIKAGIQGLPPSGPKRVEILLSLRESLQDPELIIRPQLARELAEFVLKELPQASGEWRETAHLCEIGGLTRQVDVRDPIRDVYQRATGLGLKSAARGALLSLGLSEAELNRRPPIQSILVLEPSAFFRKRMLNSLVATGLWKVSEASCRGEAEAILAANPQDLLLAESQDGQGDLAEWLDEGWHQRRFRHVILSTANRDLGSKADAPWLLGTLFKPYPAEQLLRALES
jgi:HEAT repeat protein